MFRIVDCKLTIADGEMSAVITLSGEGFQKLYMGTGEQAEKNPDGVIEIYQTIDGQNSFAVPVAALEKELDCSGLSKRKQTWYDHKITFQKPTGEPLAAETVQADVTLAGGTGRASIESPATIKNGIARIVWSSPHYDLMIVDGAEYRPVNTDGSSVFEIPVTLGVDMPIQAETIAMSEPHLIDYVLRFEQAGGENPASTELKYAGQFLIEYLADGCKLIEIQNVGKYLVVPQNVTAPKIDGAVILRQPLDNIYIAATSAMCLFDAIDGLPSIKLSGTKQQDWYNANAQAAMQSGAIKYAGKYSAPDYELLTASGCKLAIESSMINHSPAVKEKLESLGIPVLVDMSSYEKHPLGRTEWIKLYAALLDKEDVAERLFNEQIGYMNAAVSGENSGKTVAFFYISSNGYAVTRKPGDYVTKMIELAGGKYVFDDLGGAETATSTVTLEMEKFYATAKDADIIIYNAAIGGEVRTIEELVAKNQLLKDFKAVKNGNTWCTDKNMFQETTQIGQMIADMRNIFENSGDSPAFMYRLK
jgi:iron complex transport system substrate-binding protein